MSQPGFMARLQTLLHSGDRLAHAVSELCDRMCASFPRLYLLHPSELLSLLADGNCLDLEVSSIRGPRFALIECSSSSL